MINESIPDEIQALLASNIVVVTRANALKAAAALQRLLDEPDDGFLLKDVLIDSVDGEELLVLNSLDEVEHLREAIVDFDERITAGLIPRDSIQHITVNSDGYSGGNWNPPMLAILGQWEPKRRLEQQRVNSSERAIQQYRISRTIAKEVATIATPPMLCFLNGADKLDVQATNQLLGVNKLQQYQSVMSGLMRPVDRWLPTEEHLKRVIALQDEMPHLGEFLDEVISAIELAIRFEAKRFTLPPMLLNGPPGVGKTFGLFALSEALDLTSVSLPVSTMNAGFVLSGMERGWRDPEPGMLAKHAAKSAHINPIFILDEFEKIPFKRDIASGGLEPALLQILERDSAQRFYDVFLEQELNLSEISYIASSNSTRPIPKPLLSRLKVIEVGFPGAEAMAKLCSSILNKALTEDYGIDRIRVAVVGDFSKIYQHKITPRLIRNYAGRILSRSLRNNAQRTTIQLSLEEIRQVIPDQRESTDRGIGFMATL